MAALPRQDKPRPWVFPVEAAGNCHSPRIHRSASWNLCCLLTAELLCQGWNSVVHAGDRQEEVCQPCLTRRTPMSFILGLCWKCGLCAGHLVVLKKQRWRKSQVGECEEFLWMLHNSPRNILYILLMKVKLIGNTLEWKNVWRAVWSRRQKRRGVRSSLCKGRGDDPALLCRLTLAGGARLLPATLLPL